MVCSGLIMIALLLFCEVVWWFLDMNRDAEENIEAEEDIDYISKGDFLKNVTGSTIVKYSVNNYNEIISTKQTEYAPIMRDIWKTMTRVELLEDRPKGQMIICDDSMKKKYYYKKINTHHNLYFHGQDANGTMKEILYLCEKKIYTIKITIKKNDKLFSYKQ